MDGLRFKVTGPDAALLARIMVLLKALFSMECFKMRPDRLASEELLQQLFDAYQQAFEGGKYGDRNWIAKRKQARAEIIEHILKVLHFLESVADDKEVIILQNAGVERRKATRKKANHNTKTEQQEVVVAPVPT